MKLATGIKFGNVCEYFLTKKEAPKCNSFLWLKVGVSYDPACGFFDLKVPVLINLN